LSERLSGILGIFRRGQNDHRKIRPGATELHDRRQSAHTRHHEIEDDEIEIGGRVD
jgi:hypothetical protein